MSFQLRQYQNGIHDQVRSLMRQSTRRILIQLATGGGKTLLTANMLNIAASKGFRSWFIVHRRELVKQTIQSFSDMGIKKFGVIAAGFSEAKGHPIQICSIQTLLRRYKNLYEPKFIAWDECHHVSAASWSAIFDHYKNSFHVGLTATPQRLDGAGLIKYFSSMVQGPSVSWLIDNKFLSPYKLYAPSSINTQGIHSQMGDFARTELNLACDRPAITGCAIEHYQRLAENKRAVVFCVSVEHSKHVVEKFKQSGIAAAHVDGETPVFERDAAIGRFRRGEIKVLSNVDLFGEGFDLPSLEVAILLRPTQSLVLYLQQVGRVLRVSPGKSHAIILDHAGNCERHGLPDQEREWSLEGRSKSKTTGKAQGFNVKVCPKCYAAQFIGAKQCRSCGIIFDVAGREVEQIDGDLVEVDPQVIRQRNKLAQGKCRTKEELIAEGRRRGLKFPERWAHYVFQARQAKKLQGIQ